MKSTWPMPAPRVGDSTPPIFHLLALGLATNFSVRVGGNANFSMGSKNKKHLGGSTLGGHNQVEATTTKRAMLRGQDGP